MTKQQVIDQLEELLEWIWYSPKIDHQINLNNFITEVENEWLIVLNFKDDNCDEIVGYEIYPA